MIGIIKLITVTLIIILCIQYYPHLSPQNISAFIKGNSISAPLIFIVICTIRPVLFFLPSMGLTIVAGVLFGAIWGTIYVAIGGAFSTMVGFYFARWLGRNTVERFARMNNRIRQMDEWAKQHGKSSVLSMRLFNVPWDMVSYWAGLSGIQFKEFYIASIIPLVPISFLYTYFGTQVFTPTSAGFIISLSIISIMGAMSYIKYRFFMEIYRKRGQCIKVLEG
jgi:uncharacterized membrane protein YdjX (TVP38/TMEM64 family)